MIYFSDDRRIDAYEPKLPRELKQIYKSEGSQVVDEHPQEHEKNKNSSFEQKLKTYERLSSTEDSKNKGRVRSTSAEEIMTKQVSTISSSAFVENALQAMEAGGFHHYPVTDKDGVLVGIVSESDLLRAPAKASVSSVMTKKVLTTDIHSSLRDMSVAMLSENIGALPVIDENSQLVGMVTRTDILKALVTKAPVNVWV